MELSELKLDKPTEEPTGAGSTKARWIVISLGALVIAVGVNYLARQWLALQEAPRPRSETEIALPAAPESSPAGVAEPGENIFLPPLEETDGLVRQLVQRLSSHPRVAAWLVTNDLIRNFTVVTQNVADGQTPVVHLRSIRPTSRFRVKETTGAVYIDPRSYDRYDSYADAIGGMDARGAARLYATLKPRINEASLDLGNISGDFDPIMERAIVQLLRVPVVETDISLKPKVLSYAYADPRLETLSAAERQFLRMGPRNVRIVQLKLREIAGYLGIPASRLPKPTAAIG